MFDRNLTTKNVNAGIKITAPAWVYKIPTVELGVTGSTFEAPDLRETAIYLLRLADEMDEAAEIEQEKEDEPDVDPDFLSTTLEETPGYKGSWNTVVGYLAEKGCDIGENFGQRAGFKMHHACRREGIEPLKVEAPRALQEWGVANVNAYPILLLEETLG